jgi:hypothetical protein
MRRGRRAVRFGIIGAAGLVLLVTALPQVASGIGLGSLANRLDGAAICSSGSGSGSGSCCSGSSGSDSGSGGSGSGQCTTGPGTVTGAVTVTGGPKTFSPAYAGAGACLDEGNPDVPCADPVYSLAADGSYSLSLDPGTWVVDGFYEDNASGGAFLGTPTIVTVTSGGTLVVNATVPYSRPAKLKSTVTVTGLPSGVAVQDATVLLCPAGSPYSGGVQPITCVNGGAAPATPGAVVISGLPGGQWTAYPGYCTEFGCATGTNGTPVTLRAGATSRVKLSTPWVVPPVGVLNATVSVSGAPAGFDDQVGLTACQITLGGSTCEGQYGPNGSAISLELNSGIWAITGAYLAPVFGNAITGPTEIVDVVGGQVTDIAVAILYQVLGTAAGAIKLTGAPTGTHVTSYSVTACPAGGSAFDTFPFLSCVSEYSGSGGYSYGAADTSRLGRTAHRVALPRAGGSQLNSYVLPTLTPGQWQLQASYTTAFGTFSAPSYTTVTVNGAATTTTKLTIPYQVPQTGAVTGKVDVVGALPGGFQAGARACSTDPSDGTCTDETDAYLGATGTYALDLPAGNWWVQGIVYVYTGITTQTVTSAAWQVAVAVGKQQKANFTVAVG